MPLTQAELDGLTPDSSAVAMARLMNESLIEQIDTAEKHEQALVDQNAAFQAQNALLGRIAATVEGRIAVNKRQQLWTDLYALHLKTRLGPAIINSTTTDTVIRDLVMDAVAMTNDVHPLAAAAMRSFDPDPASWE